MAETLIPPYPLQWPDGVARTPPARRIKSPFRTGLDAALKNVADSLRLFQKEAGVKIEHVQVSSNVTLLDKCPPYPGAVAWFRMDGQWVAFGVDRFPTVEANIQAIHHIIEARRTELRYGGLAIVRQTFRAFVALPAPGSKKPWWDVLQVSSDASIEVIEANYRRLSRDRHPDKGGSDAQMAELNAAKAEAIAARGR
jgi:hypothetical protein